MRQFNKSVEITHDGESTEMRTMRRSSESLQFRDMANVIPQNVVIENTTTGSLSLNNSKLWQKQFGRHNHNPGSKHPSSRFGSRQPKVLKSDKAPKVTDLKSGTSGQHNQKTSLVNEFLT